MKSNVIIINSGDNVAIALSDIMKGAEVVLPDLKTFTALEEIKYSHKVAVTPIPARGAIIKYGEEIGRAKQDIQRGELVHLHNMIIEEV